MYVAMYRTLKVTTTFNIGT